MDLDMLFFYLTDALGALGMILTTAATVACHVVAFAIVWGARKPHVLRKPRWYDTVTDWADDREGFTWSLFAVASVGLGIGIALASARYDLPTEMILGLCLVVPLLGTYVGLLKHSSRT